jgi:hypothetical protein
VIIGQRGRAIAEGKSQNAEVKALGQGGHGLQRADQPDMLTVLWSQLEDSL